METNKIYQGDCLEVMKKIEDESINLIILDPPYNIGIAEWDIVKDYLSWINRISKEVFIKLKKNGSLYLFGSKDYIAEIKTIFSQNGFDLVSWCFWNKGSKAQNSIRSYADITEHCLFFCKNPSKVHSVDYLIDFSKFIKDARIRKGYTTKKCRELIGKRIYSSCGNAGWLWIETGRIPEREEYQKIKDILDLDNSWDWLVDKYTFNVDDIRIKRDPKEKRIFVNEDQLMRNVWYSNNKLETLIANHPTIKPIEIIEMIVKVSSNIGDLILDPMCGSGTTAVACINTNRKFIGIELEAKYVEIANNRIKEALAQSKLCVVDGNPAQEKQ